MKHKWRANKKMEGQRMSKLNVQVREDEEDKEGGEEEGEVMIRGEGKQNSVNHENKNIKKS